MFGIMLLGAWFLVQQHCCVADIRTSSRSNLVDHLMRRSPLEKNFMRYGRSWPPPNFIPSSVWQMDEKVDKLEKRGKTGRDIMRFGRSMWAPLEVTEGKDGFKHLYPLLPGSAFRIENLESVEGITGNNGEVFQLGLNRKYSEHPPEVSRILRNKKNFIRFGRNFKQPTCQDGELKEANQNLSKTGEDSKHSKEKTSDGNTEEFDGTKYESREEQQVKRKLLNIPEHRTEFGKSSDSLKDEESNSQYATEKNKIDPTTYDVQSRSARLRFGGLVPPLSLDSTSFIAPEFLLLPNIQHQRNLYKRANNFIRLG